MGKVLLREYYELCEGGVCQDLLTEEEKRYAAEAKTQQAEREKAALQDQLYAAKKLIDQVMSEGGKLLDSYHLDYSDLDFGGDDEEERCKLGEGAQVTRAATPPQHLYYTALLLMNTTPRIRAQVRHRVQGHVPRRARGGGQDHARRQDHAA